MEPTASHSPWIPTLGRIPAIPQPTGHSYSSERIEHGPDGGSAFALEGSGDVVGGEGLAGAGQDRLDRADLFGEGGGPGDDVVVDNRGGLAKVELLGDGGLIVGCLELRAEPADETLGFLGGAFLVEGNEAGEDFLVGEGLGPAVGFGHEPVDGVVVLADEGDEAAVVDVTLGVSERLAGPQGFEDIVELGQRQVVVFGEDPLAQGVERLGLSADLVLERFGGVCGERERVEAATVVVAGAILQ